MVRDLTQEGLARAARVSLITVSRWERDKNKPSARQIPLVSEALGVDAEWLMQDDAVASTPSAAGGPLESALDAWLTGRLEALGLQPQSAATNPFLADVTQALSESVAARAGFQLYALGKPGRPSYDPSIDLEGSGL